MKRILFSLLVLVPFFGINAQYEVDRSLPLGIKMNHFNNDSKIIEIILLKIRILY